MTIPSSRSLIFEVKSKWKLRLRQTSDVFGCLRKTSDFFGRLRTSSGIFGNDRVVFNNPSTPRIKISRLYLRKSWQVYAFNYRNVAGNFPWHSKSKENASSSVLLARKSRILNEETWNRLEKSSLVSCDYFFPFLRVFSRTMDMTSPLLPKLAYSRTA